MKLQFSLPVLKNVNDLENTKISLSFLCPTFNFSPASRRTNWVRNWAWWRYFAAYFPHKLVKTADLDPKRNYLFCIYPHGVLSTGVFSALCTNALNVDKVFPHHKTHLLSLHQHFFAPLSREVGLSLGKRGEKKPCPLAAIYTPGGCVNGD